MRGGKLVGWNLRRLRVAKSVSQENLAHEADVDRAYLSSLERGHENPTVDLLDRIAAALASPLSQLFVEPKAGDPAPQPLKGGRRTRATRNQRSRRTAGSQK